MHRIHILAISGSLRAQSSNTAVLRAAAVLAQPLMNVNLYTGLSSLPHFNPDDNENPSLLTVAELRSSVKAADGVLISSPEYAHGVPGSLKNALDWLVGSGEFVGKPVALINASPRATMAQASLKETLLMMTATIVEEASITLPLLGSGLDEQGIISHAEFSIAIKKAMQQFSQVITVSKVAD